MTKELNAKARTQSSSASSRKFRANGLVPAIIYGLGKPNSSITLEHNTIFHALNHQDFHVSVLTINVEGHMEHVVLRDFQVHPFRQQIMHLDFQRVDAKTEVQIKVPLNFINADSSVAVKMHGAHITYITNELEIRALPKDIPSSITVDLGKITSGSSVHISNIALPEGVVSVNLLRGDDAVIAIATGNVNEGQSGSDTENADIDQEPLSE